MPLSREDALKILEEYAQPVRDVEMTDLWHLESRVLAEDIIAPMDQPPFPRSPLDGYALRAADIAGAAPGHPAVLSVIDEVCAGHVSGKKVLPGTAVRIMTGAPIPEGADCVVMQEHTDCGEQQAAVYEELAAGDNICPAGEDHLAGDLLLAEGTLLHSAETGILAGAGLTQVPVYRRPRIALLTTGDETVLPGKPLGPGKIYNSNLFTVGNALLACGAELICREHVPDDPALAAERIREAAPEADMIVTTGGVSVGKKDIMHDVFSLLPVRQLFWKIAMKPGMPTLCGLWQGKLVICLSGNPYAAAAGADLLVRPLLSRMMHRPDLMPVRRQAVLMSDFPKSSRVTRYLRGALEKDEVRLTDSSSGSGTLAPYRGSSCLLEIPAGSGPMKPGDIVNVFLLRQTL